MLLLTNNYVVTISITEQPTEKLIGLFKETSNILNFHSSDLTVKLIDDTHMEKLCFTQFSTRMAAWLLLTFFICLHNHLNYIYSIIPYKSTDVWKM